METIVQKALFYKLVNAMNIKGEVNIEETHGGALIQIKHKILQGSDNEEYMVGIQFQDDTAKINYRHLDLKAYKSSSKKNIPRSVKDFFETISEDGTINEGRTKEYYSTSIKMPHNYYTLSFNDACNMYKAVYDKCVSLIDKHIHILEDNPNWHEN